MYLSSKKKKNRKKYCIFEKKTMFFFSPPLMNHFSHFPQMDKGRTDLFQKRPTGLFKVQPMLDVLGKRTFFLGEARGKCHLGNGMG